MNVTDIKEIMIKIFMYYYDIPYIPKNNNFIGIGNFDYSLCFDTYKYGILCVSKNFNIWAKIAYYQYDINKERRNYDGNTSFGRDALLFNKHGKNNLGIGYNSGRYIMDDNNICIMNEGYILDKNTIRLGNRQHLQLYIPTNTYIDPQTARPLYIDACGRIGTLPRTIMDEIDELKKEIEKLKNKK